ncbi:hypothetical protein [Saccharopolyspora antimicrobica]|uniref:hypothetical protein n=1 Tax=Saccharopolyspora antimicrobica TaxID=455193 RepID=UPI000EB604EB|nr:hypothetical protein [Saccharopolyspora antimicrobica]
MTWDARAGIMWGVADQHEPEPGSNLPDKSRPADIVDAEVVDGDLVAAPTPAKPAQPADDEEFRQFQEFQKFQRYREWQQAQGGDLAVPPPTGAQPAEQPKKPWWKTALGLLRYKFVRRLIYLLVLLLLLNYAYDYYFGSSNSSSDTSSSGQPPVRPQPRKAPTPEDALFDIYNLLRGDDPALACGLFDATGENGFAVAHQAPDCATAAQRVHDQITDRNAYANPKLGYDAIDATGREAVVHGCRIQVAGGPRLGSLKLTQQQDGGWAISAYALQSSTCP